MLKTDLILNTIQSFEINNLVNNECIIYSTAKHNNSKQIQNQTQQNKIKSNKMK